MKAKADDELWDLSKALWGEVGFPLIFFFDTVPLQVTWEELRDDLEYKSNYRAPSWLLKVHPEKVTRLGGLQTILDRYAISDNDAGAIKQELEPVLEDPGTIDSRITEVESALDRVRALSLQEPSLTDEVLKQSQVTTFIPRDVAFRVEVKKLYNYTCAVSRRQLYGPNGKRPEVESAHIYPRRFNGSDDVRNGLCLSRIYHWAFDVGWFSLTDEHTIITKELPVDASFDFLRNFAGKKINLPEDQNLWPHPIYLAAHRALHGFGD